MTTIKLKPSKYAPSVIEVTINGRFVEVANRISEIRMVSAGKWEGQANGYDFTIIGGKASGGASNEWFVEWEHNGDSFIQVSSAAEAIRCIELA